MSDTPDFDATPKLVGKTVILENPSGEEMDEAKDKVLVVEDEDQLRNLLAAVLSSEGYDVETAPSADAALPLVEENYYNCVLSDVMMPGMSGTDFLLKAKKIRPGTEFIIMTGFPKVDSAVQAMKVGAFDYVSKPFELHEIRERVSAAIEHGKTAAEGGMDATIISDNSTRYLAGYAIVRTLGEGSMGIVFLAERTVNQVSKKFAMKIIKNNTYSGKNEAVERFFKEAKTSGQLDHPNIVKVLEHGYAREENIPYLVMEYFEGVTLKKAIQNNKYISFEDKIRIVMQIARAIGVAHKHSIFHRDIKPDNIMITEDNFAKLADFGIAQLPDSEQTNVMKIIGTPYYLAPEGYNSPKVGNQADIYSLGTVAYELLLGSRPFDAETISALGFKVQTENPLEPLKIDKNFPVNLQSILEKMLQKETEKRYKTGDEVADDLEKVLSNGFQKKKVLQRVSWNTL
ncbi:MAG: protein kinase [Lentisphaeraceae bacterium]|nr:protein kinase [Lentisphaeraceae bacterium]